MVKIDEIIVYLAILTWFIFINVNVDPTLGQIYSFFAVGAVLLYIFDTKKEIPFDKDGKWGEAFIASGVIYISFILVSSALIPLFQKINVGGLISLLGAATPVLANSVILNFLTLTGPIALIETMFWLRSADFIATRLNLQINARTILTITGITLISVLSFMFMIFHATAKGLENNAALVLVFIMMFVTLATAFYYKEGKQAVLFHMTANFLAAAKIYGLI